MIQIPTLQQLYQSILSDLQTEFGISIPAQQKNFLRSLAAVQAAKLFLFYLGVGDVQKNIFADTADSEANGGTLERFGRVKIGRNPFPATQAAYYVNITGTTGSVIPAGRTWKSDDNSRSPGMLYVLDVVYTMPGTTGTISLRALTAGTVSQLDAGDTLTATSPLIGIEAGATVDTWDFDPVDAETIEEYRAKVLQSYRLYPQGGSSADYRLWGLDATGTRQIYPYAASGAPNEVNVFVEATIGASTDGMGTPTTGILNAVEDRIETDPVTGKGRRPLGVFAVNVMPVVVNKLAITITGGNISPANQALITQALTEAVEAVRPFIGGADILAQRNEVFGINNAIAAILNTVPGTLFTNVTMTNTIGSGSPTPESALVFDNGNIPFLQTVNYL